MASMRCRLVIDCDQRVLRISHHAKLRHVETLLLCLSSHPNGFDFVYDGEDDECRSEGPHGAQRRSPELDPELACVSMEKSRDPLAGSAKITGCANAVPTTSVCSISKDAKRHRGQPTAQSMD